MLGFIRFLVPRGARPIPRCLGRQVITNDDVEVVVGARKSQPERGKQRPGLPVGEALLLAEVVKKDRKRRERTSYTRRSEEREHRQKPAKNRGRQQESRRDRAACLRKERTETLAQRGERDGLGTGAEMQDTSRSLGRAAGDQQSAADGVGGDDVEAGAPHSGLESPRAGARQEI